LGQQVLATLMRSTASDLWEAFLDLFPLLFFFSVIVRLVLILVEYLSKCHALLSSSLCFSMMLDSAITISSLHF
jgi:hypothetical protein